MAAATISTTASNHPGVAAVPWPAGIRWCRNSSSKAEKARTIVNALSQEKLPLNISQPWVTTMHTPATSATGWGANKANGTTNWVKWLAATSTRWSGFGRWWKNQVNGLGIGW